MNENPYPRMIISRTYAPVPPEVLGCSNSCVCKRVVIIVANIVKIMLLPNYLGTFLIKFLTLVC